MIDYYKLVKPDLTAFYDPSFKWPLTGVVEVPNAASDGSCGPGLHLARTVKDGLQYAKFPFRIIRVRPLTAVLGQDESKIRVAKAEALGEIPVPAWAKKIEKRIKQLPGEIKAIPWFNGDDPAAAEKLIRSHFKLLVPFGFKLDFDIEIVTERKDAAAAWAARNAVWDAACDAAREAARDAAAWDAARAAVWDPVWAAAWGAARAAVCDPVWAAAWGAVWAAAWGAARNAVWDAVWDAAREAARDAADSLFDHPNPFKPLWKCWKTGAWPIGFVGDKFKLFVPRKGMGACTPQCE